MAEAEHSYSVCAFCHQAMGPVPAGCTLEELTHAPTGLTYARYFHDGPLDRCADCNAPPGGLHHPGCAAERCPRCAGRVAACGCLWAELAAAPARVPEPEHPFRKYCGQDCPHAPHGWAAGGYFCPGVARSPQPEPDALAAYQAELASRIAGLEAAPAWSTAGGLSGQRQLLAGLRLAAELAEVVARRSGARTFTLQLCGGCAQLVTGELAHLHALVAARRVTDAVRAGHCEHLGPIAPVEISQPSPAVNAGEEE